MFASYLKMVDLLSRCMDYRVRDNRTSTYPRSIYSDWNGFFSKEIFDPLFVLYVAMCSGRDKVDYSVVLERLCNVVAQISFERLELNELEPNLNVLDLDLDGALILNSGGGKKTPVLFLNDRIKTVINYLVPNLRNELACVQMSSYRVLRTVMKEMSRFYEIREVKTDEENEEDESQSQKSRLNIIKSLPYSLRTILADLTELFRDLKNSVPFDESILVSEDEYDDDAASLPVSDRINNKLMSFLLTNKLILDMFATSSFEFKVKLANDVREANLNDFLMHCLFRIMIDAERCAHFQSVDLGSVDFMGMDEIDADLLMSKQTPLLSMASGFSNQFVEFFACKLYKLALKCVPAIVRDWWNMQPKRIADKVDKFTTK